MVARTQDELMAVLTLTCPYLGIKEVSRVLAIAEEDGALDFDFSVEIRIIEPERREDES